MIDALTGQGHDARYLCRVLGIARSGYYTWKKRGPSPRELRRVWLGGLIADIHASSNETYGYRRVVGELRLAHDLTVNHKLVAGVMRDLGLQGLPKPKSYRSSPANTQTAADLVKRDFCRDAPKLSVDDRYRAPRGAVEPCGDERTPLSTRRSGLVKLGVA